MGEISNQELIKRIRAYQSCPLVHELTCGNDRCRQSLIPKEQDGAVVLICPEAGCGYVQTYIPEEFFALDFKVPRNPYKNR